MKGMAIEGPALQEQPRQISPTPDVSEHTSSASAKCEGQANKEARGSSITHMSMPCP
jgi:hypothetical protein